MKQSLLVACTLLGGCALAGIEGPERKAQAQQALRDFPGQLNSALAPGGSEDNTSQQLDEMRRQASWDAFDQQQQLQRMQWDQEQHRQQQEFDQTMERLRNGEPP